MVHKPLPLHILEVAERSTGKTQDRNGLFHFFDSFGPLCLLGHEGRWPTVICCYISKTFHDVTGGKMVIICMQIINSDFCDCTNKISTWEVVERRDTMDRKGGTSLTELLTKVEITGAAISQTSNKSI